MNRADRDVMLDMNLAAVKQLDTDRQKAVFILNELGRPLRAVSRVLNVPVATLSGWKADPGNTRPQGASPYLLGSEAQELTDKINVCAERNRPMTCEEIAGAVSREVFFEFHICLINRSVQAWKICRRRNPSARIPSAEWARKFGLRTFKSLKPTILEPNRSEACLKPSLQDWYDLTTNTVGPTQ